MATKTEHLVIFHSPGTFFDETTSKPIPKWDTKIAVSLAEGVRERHGAKPYGFVFVTVRTADPIPDGEGGTLEVRPKETKRSGIHYLGGRIETYAEVVSRNDPNERILRDNMRANRMPLVVVNTNSYRTTRPFGEDNCVVGPSGEMVESARDPKWEEVRKKMLAVIERDTDDLTRSLGIRN